MVRCLNKLFVLFERFMKIFVNHSRRVAQRGMKTTVAACREALFLTDGSPACHESALFS